MEGKTLDVKKLLEIREKLKLGKAFDFEGSLSMNKDQFILECLNVLYGNYVEMTTQTMLCRCSPNSVVKNKKGTSTMYV
jgi:hypothetical protein